MYDCLPMYHTAGGVVATGALLVNGGSVVIREKFSAREFWDDVVRCGLHAVPVYRRAVPLSGQRAAAPERDASTGCGSPAATGLRPDIWQEFKTRFRIPHILEFYAATEGNVTLFNFEGKARRGRPHPVVRRQPLPDHAGALRRRAPAAGARRATASASLRRRRGRRGDRQDRQRPVEARQPLRGLRRRPPRPSSKILRDVFEHGRRLVPHRRPDAQGRRTAISISSTASATRSAGRARTSRPPRSPRRSAPSPASGTPTSTACACRAATAAPAWRRSSATATSISPPCTRIWRAQPARLCAAAVPAHPQRDRRDRDVQAEEDRSGARGLRSRRDQRSDLFQRPAGQGLRAARRGALRSASSAGEVRL